MQDLYVERMNDNLMHKNAILTHIPKKRKLNNTFENPHFGGRRYLNVLDFGGGSGNLSRIIKGTMHYVNVTYCDNNKEMLNIAKENNSAHSYIEDFKLLPFCVFDIIICSSVLHEIEDWEATLKYLIQYNLRHNGKIIIRDGLFPFDGHKEKIKIKLKDPKDANKFYERMGKDSIMGKLEVNFNENYIEGYKKEVYSFLQTYTWGWASMEREKNEDFLRLGSYSIDSIFKNSGIGDSIITTLKQNDYFDYLRKVCVIEEEWDTHLFAVGIKGD